MAASCLSALASELPTVKDLGRSRNLRLGLHEAWTQELLPPLRTLACLSEGSVSAWLALRVPFVVHNATPALCTAGRTIMVSSAALLPGLCAGRLRRGGCCCRGGLHCCDFACGGRRGSRGGRRRHWSGCSRIHGLCGTDFSNCHISKGDVAPWMLAAYIPRRAVLTAWAHATADAWFAALSVFRVTRVQPHHVDIDVIPERKCRNVTTAQGLAHGFVATFLLKVVLVIEKVLHVFARLVRDGVWIAWCLRKDRDGWACHGSAVLHVETADF
mmetsp:Transcript_5979/g.14142  ORF Transcript_5979/g.14142 Transcript_5979/m.14142 type:complete len:272 (+) Transcript_5979:313-1128(+)